MEVPVARNAAVTCGLGGNHEMFETAKLNALYRNHGSYVSKVSHATNAAVNAGFLLPEDAEITKDKAAGSIIGFGLELRVPVHRRGRISDPSVFQPVARPDGCSPFRRQRRPGRDTRRSDAEHRDGIHAGERCEGQAKLRQGDRGSAELYCQVQERQASGHVVTETSTLLIDQTNTLIKELEAL